MSFEEILFYLTTKQAIVIYMALLLSAFIENIFPPFPSDIITLVGAFMASRGDLTYIPLFITVTVGGLTGAMLLYYLGRFKGRSFFRKYDKYYLRIDNLHKIERWFKRWGVLVLIVSRFMAGIRSVVAIAAGVGNVPAGRMAVFTFISFCLWYSVLIGGMYLLKSNWPKLVEAVKSYNILLVIISALAITAWLIIIYRRSGIKR